MTVRYHRRRGAEWPDYLCQRNGVENARPVCAALPGTVVDHAVGQLMMDALTPLAVEAALAVTAELEHRAAEADALRAAHVERARYHADQARRRYLAVDPANRLVADALEADWNTALRELNDARPPTTRPATSTRPSSPPPSRTRSPGSSPTCPPSGTTPPPPCASASASPGCWSPTSP